MKLLASREYSVIDYQTLAEFIGHERLFRMPNGRLLLHMASERDPEADERVIWLNLRDAMTWLNEPPEQYGSFWDEDGIATAQSTLRGVPQLVRRDCESQFTFGGNP